MYGIIGIMAEHKSGERRIPLTPPQLQQIKQTNKGIDFLVQPSEQRVFNDSEFTQKGIQLDSDLSSCNLVMAVKEIDVAAIKAGQAYLYFSHTIKGQPYNMPMLKHILDVGATLLDYELIKDSKGHRLVFFGRHAGLAGMVNTLWSYGQRLLAEGIQSPFAKIKQAREYQDLLDIREAMKDIGSEITDFLENRPALVIGITGYGNVSGGAQEILDILPHTEITPEELLSSDPDVYRGKVVKVVFKEEDMFTPTDPSSSFDLQEYFTQPEKYVSKFNPHLERLNILVNCIYWDTVYPRLITKNEIKEHYNGRPVLKVVGDITCDIEGAIEFNLTATNSDDPSYVYHPDTDSKTIGFKGNGPVVMAVDNLPTELPREASASFGEALIPFIPALASCDFKQPLDSLDLPEELKGAIISHQGKLVPEFKYLEENLSV